MDAANLRSALVMGHFRFITEMASSGDWDAIKKWVMDNLVNRNPDTTLVSINSFFEAENEFIRACISVGNVDKVKRFLNAVDHEIFDTNNLRHKKLKLNQCKVLADGVKMAESFLKGNDAMYKQLNELLQAKQNELNSLELEGKEKDFRDQTLSTLINEALKIVQVQVCPSGGSMGK